VIKDHGEIIDYTHARQNFQEAIDKLPKNLGTKKTGRMSDSSSNLRLNGSRL
jgi:hypothetical protein